MTKKNIFTPLLQKERKYNMCHDNLYLRIRFSYKKSENRFYIGSNPRRKSGGGEGRGGEEWGFGSWTSLSKIWHYVVPFLVPVPPTILSSATPLCVRMYDSYVRIRPFSAMSTICLKYRCGYANIINFTKEFFQYLKHSVLLPSYTTIKNMFLPCKNKNARYFDAESERRVCQWVKIFVFNSAVAYK